VEVFHAPNHLVRRHLVGLVTVPIHVVSATEDHSIRFHQVRLDDMARVRVRKYCEIEDREVTQGEIGKGYELSKDTIIAVSDEELQQMPLPTAKAIELVAFMPAESIDPIRVGDGYYLQPDGQVAAKPYKLLAQALERASKVAVAKFAWSGRERLGLLRVRAGVIVLHAMRWDDEIRDPAELAPDAVELTDEEITEAQLLIDRLTRDELEGPDFTDQYTEAVSELIEAKRVGKEPPTAAEQEAPAGEVVDLMAALQESVAKARTARGEDATVHELPEKLAAKKTEKRQPAKKAAAKKAAGRKPRSALGAATARQPSRYPSSESGRQWVQAATPWASARKAWSRSTPRRRLPAMWQPPTCTYTAARPSRPCSMSQSGSGGRACSPRRRSASRCPSAAIHCRVRSRSASWTRSRKRSISRREVSRQP
jgi:DNA end-binding protein Ku